MTCYGPFWMPFILTSCGNILIGMIFLYVLGYTDVKKLVSLGIVSVLLLLLNLEEKLPFGTSLRKRPGGNATEW